MVRRREQVVAPSKVVPGPGIHVERPPFLRIPWLDAASFARTVAGTLRRRLDRHTYDVVVGHGILADRAASRLASRRSIPYVAHWLDALDELVFPGWARPFARRIIRANLRRAARVIVINRRLEDYVLRRGARSGTTRVVPAGIDAAKYRNDESRDRVRRELKVPPDAVVLVFLGWLYEFGGVDTVAESLLHRADGTRPIILVVAGDGDLRPRLEKLAKHPKAGGRIRILGPQPFSRIPDLLSAADACLLPARSHAAMDHIVPIKLYEYLAAGRPVYSTRLDGVVAEFRDDPAFRFVDAADEILERVIADGIDPRTTLHEATKIRRSAHLQPWEHVVDRFEAELHAVRGTPA